MERQEVQYREVEKILAAIEGQKLTHVERNVPSHELINCRREAVWFAVNAHLDLRGTPSVIASTIDEYWRQEEGIHEKDRFGED